MSELQITNFEIQINRYYNSRINLLLNKLLHLSTYHLLTLTRHNNTLN